MKIKNAMRAFRASMRPGPSAVTDGPVVELESQRHDCICGAPRRDVADHMWRVSDKESDPFNPKFFYRCPYCMSFSAPQIYFPADKYDTLPIEFYGKGHLTDVLAGLRVGSLVRELGGSAPGSVLLDLGSGGGWVAKRFAQDVAAGRALAVEVDSRLGDPYYSDVDGVEFVPELIDDFLIPFAERVERGEQAAADAAIMTDVLEHLLWPEVTVELIHRALRPGGVGYFVVPNSLTFAPPHPFPVAVGAVDWDHAKHTCQHIWMMSPEAVEGMFSRVGFTVLAHDLNLESDVRRDSVYSTLIVRR
jgi:SAM-dependent methyltransferase